MLLCFVTSLNIGYLYMYQLPDGAKYGELFALLVSCIAPT